MKEQQMRIKMDDGAEINAQIFGETGPHLLLFHGNGEDHHIFDEAIKLLAPQFQVVAVDTRGHGESERGFAPMTFGQFSQDMFQLMDQLGIETADVIGFSDGANIAMQMGLDRQTRLNRMVWIGGNLDPGGLKPMGRVGTALLYAWTALGSLSKKGKARLEIVRLMQKQPNLAPARLRGIRVPTLVMAGEKDIIRQEHSELIANSLPFGKLTVLKGADHFVLKTAFEQAMQEITQFLTEEVRVG